MNMFEESLEITDALLIPNAIFGPIISKLELLPATRSAFSVP